MATLSNTNGAAAVCPLDEVVSELDGLLGSLKTPPRSASRTSTPDALALVDDEVVSQAALEVSAPEPSAWEEELPDLDAEGLRLARALFGTPEVQVPPSPLPGKAGGWRLLDEVRRALGPSVCAERSLTPPPAAHLPPARRADALPARGAFVGAPGAL